MIHEGFHGIFFIDEDFQNFSRGRWENLDRQTRRVITSFFDFQRYDLGDSYLIINEFMAYLLQQPVYQAGKYFGDNIARILDEHEWRNTVLPPAEIAADGSRSWPNLAGTFAREAEAFSNYVNQRWGFAAGRIRRLTVSPVE